MSISQDIIEVIDHLSSKIGIVVDWSQQNIVAGLQRLIIRFSHYKMLESVITLLLLLVAMYFLLKFIIGTYNVYKITNNIDDSPVFFYSVINCFNYDRIWTYKMYIENSLYS